MKNATVGRIVHLATSQEEHVPAIVTGINGDETVNLHVFPNSEEGAYFRRGVAQDDYTGQHAQQDTWHWPEGSREFKDSEPKHKDSEPGGQVSHDPTKAELDAAEAAQALKDTGK